MIDFNKTIFENTREKPIVCAHRGVSGGNIPCNTLPAFKAALYQGAGMIELDVSKARDGGFFVFHPGMEVPHMRTHKRIPLLSSKGVGKLRFSNFDDTETQFGVEKLEDILDFLKGKCYINVDKFWIDIEGISAVIRKCGVEKQVVVKTSIKDRYINDIKKYAVDFMYLPVIRAEDKITDGLVSRGINCVGAEILFDKESDPIISDEYIESMHKKGRVVFMNSIVYDYKEILSAGHNDDTAISENMDKAWGWLIDKKADIIQTDWCSLLKKYIDTRSK